ncbi:MAG: hypothetical protein ABGZ53_13230, partial [Fuerstiella sp.]
FTEPLVGWRQVSVRDQRTKVDWAAEMEGLMNTRYRKAKKVFLSLLDGRTTFCEWLAITARTQGAAAFSQQQALSLYSWLLERGIVEFAGVTAGVGESRPAKK